MLKAKTAGLERHALASFADSFAATCAGEDNSGVDTLRQLFVQRISVERHGGDC
jgi:hypothetical protein